MKDPKTCKPCLLSGRHTPAVARCTVDCAWHVCAYHELSAAGCGLYPRRYGYPQAMTPDEAAERRRTQ